MIGVYWNLSCDFYLQQNYTNVLFYACNVQRRWYFAPDAYI